MIQENILEIDPEKIEAWCEVCKKDIFGFSSWDEHCKTQEHLDNAVRFLLIDTGVRTIEEIPGTIDEYVDSISKEIPDDLRERK